MSLASDHSQPSLAAVDTSEERPSEISDSHLRGLAEDLLECDICSSPFDSSQLKPLLLPCTHTYCGECLECLGKSGDFACPQCRTPVPFDADLPACQQFKVDHTRLKLLDWTRALQRSERGHHSQPEGSQRGEGCDKHPGEELGLFCTTCKKLLCPRCIKSAHSSHDVSAISALRASTKVKLEKACDEVQQLMSSAEQAASDVRSELVALGSKEEATLEKMEKVIDRVEACLRRRRQTAREELKARVKQDQLQLEDVLATQESLLSSATSTLHFGRRVVQLGSDADLMLGLEQVQAALRDLATRGQQASVAPVQYQVNTKDLPLLTRAMSSYGRVLHGHNDQVPHVPVKESSEMSSPQPATHVGFTDEKTFNESDFVCQEFQYDVRRCGTECSIDVTRTTLVNGDPENRLPWPGAYTFCGTRGTEALTRSSYWEVRVTAKARGEVREKSAWCEMGIAGEAAMKAYPGVEFIGDCSSHPVATTCIAKSTTQVAFGALRQGRILGAVTVAEYNPRFNQFLLGILWDATNCQFFFIHVSTSEVMFQGELQSTEPLFYVGRTNTEDFCGAEVKVELVTGGRVQMSDEKRRLIHRLLHQ